MKYLIHLAEYNDKDGNETRGRDYLSEEDTEASITKELNELRETAAEASNRISKFTEHIIMANNEVTAVDNIVFRLEQRLDQLRKQSHFLNLQVNILDQKTLKPLRVQFWLR